MRKQLYILVSSIFISSFLAGCSLPFMDSPSVNAAKKAIRSGGNEGYTYAKDVNMDKDLLNSIVIDVAQYIDVESIDNFMNDSPVLVSDDNIDLRFATVTAKDGKTYTACFDGGRGILYALVDENGVNLVEQKGD